MNTFDHHRAAPLRSLPSATPSGAPWVQQRTQRWSAGQQETFAVRIWRPARYGDGHRCVVEVEPESDGPRGVDGPTAVEALAAALSRLALYVDLLPPDDAALTHRRVASRVAGVDVAISGRLARRPHAFGVDLFPAFSAAWRAGARRGRRAFSPPLLPLAWSAQCVVAKVRDVDPTAFSGVTEAVASLLAGGRVLGPEEASALGAATLTSVDTEVWRPYAVGGGFELPFRAGAFDPEIRAFRVATEVQAWLLAGRLSVALIRSMAVAWLPAYWEDVAARANECVALDAADEPPPLRHRPTARPAGPPLLELPLPIGADTVWLRIWPPIAEVPAQPDEDAWVWCEAPPIVERRVLGGLGGQGVLSALSDAQEWVDVGDVEWARADMAERLG